MSSSRYTEIDDGFAAGKCWYDAGLSPWNCVSSETQTIEFSLAALAGFVQAFMDDRGFLK